MPPPSRLSNALRIALFASILGTRLLAAEPPKTPPDLTVDQSVDHTLTYNLGPTGLRGWIYTRAANFRESQQGRTTPASRQILVMHVGKDSPADTVMKADDVILGEPQVRRLSAWMAVICSASA
jgi:hypothetical protein